MFYIYYILYSSYIFLISYSLFFQGCLSIYLWSLDINTVLYSYNLPIDYILLSSSKLCLSCNLSQAQNHNITASFIFSKFSFFFQILYCHEYFLVHYIFYTFLHHLLFQYSLHFLLSIYSYVMEYLNSEIFKSLFMFS